MKLILIFLLLTAPLFGSDENRILYLLQTKNPWEAFDLYHEHALTRGGHDHELLEQMALLILEQGNRSSDPEVQLFTMFGAGISLNDTAGYILENGIKSEHPNVQLIALNFLATQQSESTIEVLHQAMTSNFFPIRLEAAHQLALMKQPHAVGQIESLMQKVPPQLHAIFPQLFALAGNREGIRSLQRMLVHPDENVRIEAIHASAKYGRDDLLPQIRTVASHQNIVEQEVSSLALGALKDEHSISRLKELSLSPNTTVRLAALNALYQLGREEASFEIQAIARKGDLCAISLLGDIPGSEPLLKELIQVPNGNVRLNASLSLLNLEDPNCVSTLCRILLKNEKDLVCTRITSMGRGLSAWKIVPSGRQNFKEAPISLELSLKMRESALQQALSLPEEHFLKLAEIIFDAQQNDLVPTLVSLLENLQTPGAIALLKKQREKIGAPLIRNYCNLALFRMKEPGPYGEALQEWISNEQHNYLIEFRPFLTWEMRDDNDRNYHLTAQETSRLLIESFQAFAEARDEKGIDVLLDAIQYGNQKNKYALAGLLMRCAQ